MRVLRALVAVLVVSVFGVLCSGALAAVTPGWECVPTTAGQAVVSGGTASTPSCGTGTTAVLAPTYVSSGVGGKPTVQFASVNVQIINGAGSTSSVNGTGNLVLGYDESPGTQTGSHNLVLGKSQTYSSYGGIVGGYGNHVSGAYASAFGDGNSVSGVASSLLGGYKNTVSSNYSTLSGGCSNLVGTGTVSVSSLCSNTTTYNHDFASITGGAGNQATGISSSVTGGESGTASGNDASVSGGQDNLASDPFTFIGGGCDNVAGGAQIPQSLCASPGDESVLGGKEGSATGDIASIGGGVENVAGALDSTVGGGGSNQANGAASSIAGGFGNATNSGANYASMLGGEVNSASDVYSSIVGGCDNLAGSGTVPTDTCAGTGTESILGGDSNNASGDASSVAGGQFNIAGDPLSFVGGGCDNLTGGGFTSGTCASSGLEAVLGGKSQGSSSLEGVQTGTDIGGISFSGVGAYDTQNELITLPNGLQLNSLCLPDTNLNFSISPPTASDGLQMSGTYTKDGTLSSVDVNDSSVGTYTFPAATTKADLDVSAALASGGATDQVIGHVEFQSLDGGASGQCPYWGVVTAG